MGGSVLTSLENIKYNTLISTVEKYKDFFSRKVINVLREFERMYQNIDNISKQKTSKSYLDEVVQEEHLKKSIKNIEESTGIFYKEIKEICKSLDRNIFEMVSPQYVCHQVAELLGIKSPFKVSRIAEESDMFQSEFLVKRINRVRTKNNKSVKSSTTVVFSLLGILYLAYWLKNNGDLETYYVFSNSEIREDINQSLKEYEQGKYQTYLKNPRKIKEDSFLCLIIIREKI